ncbi:MAG: type II secretion system protein [Verrucomicrobia bacterium]|nr:type II secretion system protein [Verrucomicrobiota bacterium]
MKTKSPQPTPISQIGFTLIEMIGVLAIMAVLASVITPNALRIIEREAVRAEADSLRTLSEQIKIYIRETGLLPNENNWNTVLATYASANPTDLRFNRRQRTAGAGAIPRLYVPDPVASNQRALFISSMRQDIGLTTTIANVRANFQAIWNWNSADLSPANLPPPGLTEWTPGIREFLVIERVNLRSVPALDFIFRNTSTTAAASYRVYSVTGAIISSGAVPVHAGTTDGTASPNPQCRANQRINLYDGLGVLNYSYVVSTDPKTFVFDGTRWTPL